MSGIIMTTQSMTTYDKWDIILVPFPFTDLSTSKKRPALIISPDVYNQNSPDLIIAFITSRISAEKKYGDFLIKYWQDANLPKPSMIRMKFATINKSIIVKKLGCLTKKDRKNFKKLFFRFFKMN